MPNDPTIVADDGLNQSPGSTSSVRYVHAGVAATADDPRNILTLSLEWVNTAVQWAGKATVDSVHPGGSGGVDYVQFTVTSSGGGGGRGISLADISVTFTQGRTTDYVPPDPFVVPDMNIIDVDPVDTAPPA